jgi:hypothetical protein
MVRGEKALEEVLNVGAKDLESNALEKDNRELEAFSKGALLKSLATMNLAYVAPYLSLARVAGKECENQCRCNNPYGLVVRFLVTDNPRLFSCPYRGSENWQKLYSQRTSIDAGLRC